jgi:hypothetical protein
MNTPTKEINMNGFVVTLPSSAGTPCFLVTPGRVGQPVHTWYPWARATFVAAVFPTQHEAQAALKWMKEIHSYIAPELNGGLTARLWQAQVVPVAEVAGIEFEAP